MAELLVRVVDKVNADFYKNCECTKRGDVVVACPDGWNWGLEELARSEYRILKVPDLPLDEARAFTAGELQTDPRVEQRTLQKRKFKLDVDALGLQFPAFAAYLADAARAAPAFAVPSGAGGAAVLTAIRALKLTRPPIPDPNILGGSPQVIG